MDRGAGFGAADWSSPGSIDPSRSHPGDERGKLSAEEQQEEERVEPAIAAATNAQTPACPTRDRPAAAFGGSWSLALNAPPYGRRRARLQPPPKAEKQRTKGRTESGKPNHLQVSIRRHHRLRQSRSPSPGGPLLLRPGGQFSLRP